MQGSRAVRSRLPAEGLRAVLGVQEAQRLGERRVLVREDGLARAEEEHAEDTKEAEAVDEHRRHRERQHRRVVLVPIARDAHVGGEEGGAVLEGEAGKGLEGDVHDERVEEEEDPDGGRERRFEEVRAFELALVLGDHAQEDHCVQERGDDEWHHDPEEEAEVESVKAAAREDGVGRGQAEAHDPAEAIDDGTHLAGQRDAVHGGHLR